MFISKNSKQAYPKKYSTLIKSATKVQLMIIKNNNKTKH